MTQEIAPSKTIDVVGIQFKPGGKIYDFCPNHLTLQLDDTVVVETEKGIALGTVGIAPHTRHTPTAQPLKKVLHKASAEDFQKAEKCQKREKEAFDYCQEAIQELELEMSLFSVESSLDGSLLIFFFTADGRVDFRKLVRMLVKRFRAHIEMRQVGIRNQSKMCGGLGRCGREICCSAFLEKFDPISIRMAKEQGLSLNPAKISGQCGRLMCCLAYENDTYCHLRKGFPKLGARIKTKELAGKVLRHNVLKQKITIQSEEGSFAEIDIDQLVKDE